MNNKENISADKQFLLNWIKETDNESMIQKVKNFISELNPNLNQPKDIEIPEWQKEESARRYKELKENPGSGIDFRTMLDELMEKHDL